MADNTSNNDTTCKTIESILEQHHIYSFNSIQHRLPCLAHVLNLAIIDIMAVITRIDHIMTTAAIWEFNPMLPMNCVMNNSLDVVAAICTLAIKIQASGQQIAYFKWLQSECGISTPLAIPLQNNTRWGMADGVLGRSSTVPTQVSGQTSTTVSLDTNTLIAAQQGAAWKISGWLENIAIHHAKGCACCHEYINHLLGAQSLGQINLQHINVKNAVQSAWPTFINSIEIDADQCIQGQLSDLHAQINELKDALRM